jgi:hypothetical protein
MEALKALSLGFAQNPLYLGAEAETSRWLFLRIHLEILRHRVDALAEHPQQRGVGRLGPAGHLLATARQDGEPPQRDPTRLKPIRCCPFRNFLTWFDGGGKHSRQTD